MNIELKGNVNLLIDKYDFTYIPDIKHIIHGNDDLSYQIVITNKSGSDYYRSVVNLFNIYQSDDYLICNISLSENVLNEDNYNYYFQLKWDMSNHTYSIYSINLLKSTSCIVDEDNKGGVYNTDKLIKILFKNIPRFSEHNLNE